MMMEPNPLCRPNADEILMHPHLQIMKNGPSVKRNLNLDKMLNSPIVDKFKNPLSARN
jgi:hypothetical protein